MPLSVLRASMSDLIAELRTMINDPSGASQQFTDLQIQTRLDDYRTDMRYLQLDIAPSIVNTASTNNIASVIYADYYSDVGWWESDVVLQGNNVTTGAAWVVLTPVTSNYIVGHWTFEANIFTAGTVPGQYPPVFITGKVYDLYAAAAALLRMWASTLTNQFDFTSDGQHFSVSQLMKMKLTMADYYSRLAKPRTARMTRDDLQPEMESHDQRLIGSDVVKGAY